MEKLLEQFKGAADYATQSKYAKKIYSYGAKHPMAVCMLSKEEKMQYNTAINFFN